MNMIDKLAWLRIENNKVLCARSKGKSTFYIPGGKRESGESDQDALVREIKEEIMVELIPATLKLYGVFEAQADGKSDGTIVRITCYTSDYVGALAPDSEIEEISWLGYADIGHCSVVVQALFEQLHREHLI
jgi:8-oxo-dGTP diphosphatase